MSADRDLEAMTLDPRLAALTPDRLREIVEAGGGSVLRDWNYTYSEAEGGDGTRGHYVLFLGDKDGAEVGSVGFGRSIQPDGTVEFVLSDFEDNSHAGSAYVTSNVRGFLRLLAIFLPVG